MPEPLAPDTTEALVSSALQQASAPVHAAGCFRAIWILKRWVTRMRARPRAQPAARTNRKKKAQGPSGVTLLRERLEHLGLRMLTIGGDGNCQFRSCSHGLFGTEAHHMHVRSVCVEHMRSHAAEFSCFCVGEGAPRARMPGGPPDRCISVHGPVTRSQASLTPT